MSVVALAEAQSRLGSTITQDMIDETEEWLAARIGPLVGVRTETFYLSRRKHVAWPVDGLWLKRRTDAVSLANDGEDLVVGTDYRLFNGLLIERVPESTTWGEVLGATYEPNDEDIVRSVVFDRLVYAQMPTGIQSIRIGQYSETYATGAATSLPEVAMIRRVLPGAALGAFAEPFRYKHVRRDRTLVEAAGS